MVEIPEHFQLKKSRKFYFFKLIKNQKKAH
jgi:hypothetical protein